MLRRIYWSDGGKPVRIFKILICLTIIIGTLLYVVDITAIVLPSQLSFRLTGAPIWNWKEIRAQQEHEWDRSYFVRCQGCKMPSFPVMSDTISKFVSDVKPVVCKPALTKSNNTALWISLNKTEMKELYGVEDVEKLSCLYQPFYRQTDSSNRFDDQQLYQFRYGDILLVRDEFVRVSCVYGTVGEIYLDYHLFVPKANSMHDRNLDEDETDKKINVLILGIDSVSRLNFHRQMPRSADVILNQLQAIELFGYNKVGDNTYPNLMPALTGLNVSELASTCVPFRSSSFDGCPFIWNSYKQNGYTTLFAEDVASVGLFNYHRGGFENKSTDYRIRPALLEMESHIRTHKVGNAHLCLGGRRQVDILLDYADKFISSIGSLPYFSLFWTTSYTHDFLNYARLIDDKFTTFLSTLSTSNALNNTFLLVMSDHGIRWGSYRNTYQGMMEERQPFLYLIPPKWFPDKYPMAMKNLLSNRRKLTTHFDLYETLRDLVDLSAISTPSIKERAQDLVNIEPMPRGISFFLPVPSSRTCDLAGIAPHWCTCHEKQFIATTDAKVLRVAEMIVQSINNIIKIYPQCQMLSLNSISDATVGISNEDIVGKNSTKHFSDLTVRLQTKPGLAEFEATVRVHDDGDLQLTGTISRTNLYGSQSKCVDDYNAKLYCLCQNFFMK